MDVPSPAAVTAQLAGTALFGGLTPDALADVARLGRVRSLAGGAHLFTQGERADRCHAVLAGRVRIAQSGAEGAQVIVRFVGSGEMFGTVALFTDGRYPAGATAVVDSVEISWSEPTLLELVQRHPRIALNLVKIVGTRLRELQERFRELATQPVDQRIAHALLRLVENDAAVGNDDAAIEFPITREDVAAMCGATLYTVSRVLKAWENAGLLTTRRKRVSIHKLSEIRRIAGETFF